MDLLSKMAAAKPAPLPQDLGRVAALAQQLKAEQATIEKIEADLKAAKERARKIEEDQIPALFDEMQLSEIKLQDGQILRIKETWRDGVNEATRPAAFSWLRGEGHGDLIRNEVKISFGAAEDKVAKRLLNYLKKYLKGISYEQKETVPWNTFSSFIKEQVEQGVNLPESIGAKLIRQARFYKR